MPLRSSSQKSNAPDMVTCAEELMRLGFKVVPLQPAERGVQRSGKAPISSHGVKDATDDPTTFKRWIPASRNFNIGIAATDVVIIDVDPQNGGLEEFKNLVKQLGPLPRTPCCKSGGGGYHFYHLRPPACEIKKKILAPGVDLLAGGSYAVAPPSLHWSGARYRWLEKCGPWDLPIAPLPDSWRQFIDADNRARNEPVARDGDAIPEGSRNLELTRMAGQLRRSGFSEAEILDVLRARNKARCVPPLGDEEVTKIARNIARYAEPRDEGHKIAQTLLDAEFAGGKWLRFESDDRFWWWTGNQWAVMPDKILQQKTLKVIGIDSSSHKSAKTLVQEVFSLLQIMQVRTDDMLHFTSEPPNVVNVLNCELWLLEDGTLDVRPHNPATGMRHVLRVNYNPKAKCPEYTAAIKEIFSEAAVPSTLISFCDELMGYAIQLRRDIPLIVLMSGNGSNGKTSILKLLIALVGPNFVHSGRVDELEETRFAIGNLFGKLLFVDDDVRQGTKLPDGVLKKISEPKLLTGELKFKPAFSFVNLAFPVLAFNNPPSLADLSLGMTRRLYLLPFSQTFKEGEMDRDLFDRIIRDELPGVLNRALDGWRRLKQRGQFQRSRDMARLSLSEYQLRQPL